MNHNPSPASPEALERLAQRRAKAKIGWYTHACIYLLVNLMLAAISYSNGEYWAVYPALGWGIGLLMHGVAVFFLAGGSDLQERMVQKERDRLMRRGQGD